MLCGRDEPPLPPRLLHAGALSAKLDGHRLCYVTLHDTEIARRVYFAVRGPGWSTVPGETRSTNIEETNGRFEVTFEIVHHVGDVHFSWQGTVVGREDGTLTYEARGEALSEFTYYRIGLCVLHPLKESVGAEFLATTPGGVARGTLPVGIGPKRYEDDGLDHVTIPAFSALALRLNGGGQVQFTFEGDLFELEDQRNYTDASFKSYGTPLGLPLEHLAKPREDFFQRVEIKAVAPNSSRPARQTRTKPTIEARGGAAGRLPRIGFGLGHTPAELSPSELALLRPLHAAHLRVDLRLAEGGCADRLAEAAMAAAALGSSLELGVVVGDEASEQLRKFADNNVVVPVDRVLVFHDAEVSTSPRWVDLARRSLDGLRAAAFGGGSLGDFAEVNAVRPSAGVLDVVAWRSCPQVHADDETSMVETLPVLEDVLKTARTFCGTSELVVSPITLKPGELSWSDEFAASPGILPADVDVRQATLFGAAWTLGSLKYLTRGAAQALTFYELVGWRGLTCGDRPLPLRDAIPALPGDVYPAYHLFRDVGESAEARFVDCEASRPELVDGFGLTTSTGTTYLVCNMTALRQEAEMGPFACREVKVRRLSMQSARTAMERPLAFRKLRDREAVSGGLVNLTLEPYEVVRVDASGQEAQGKGDHHMG